MSDWMEQIANPNEPKKKRKRKKNNETLGKYFPTNQPIAHPTIKGEGIVGRLRKRKKNEKK